MTHEEAVDMALERGEDVDQYLAWLLGKTETKRCPSCSQPIPTSFLPGMTCSLCVRFGAERLAETKMGRVK